MKLGYINRDILVGHSGNINVAKEQTYGYAIKDLTMEELQNKVLDLTRDNECLRSEIYDIKIENVFANKRHLYFGICIGIMPTTLFAYVL